MLTAHHELRVVHQVQREDQRSDGSVHQGHDLVAGDEYADDTEHKQYDGGTEQEPAHDREVPFRLEGEQRQSETHGRRYSYSHHYRINIIDAGRDAEQEALRHSEHAEEYEVHGSLPPHAVAARHRYQAHEHYGEGDPEKPRIPVSPHLGGFVEQEQSNERHRHQQLAHQDCVHLTNEGPPNGLLVEIESFDLAILADALWRRVPLRLSISLACAVRWESLRWWWVARLWVTPWWVSPRRWVPALGISSLWRRVAPLWVSSRWVATLLGVTALILIHGVVIWLFF